MRSRRACSSGPRPSPSACASRSRCSSATSCSMWFVTRVSSIAGAYRSDELGIGRHPAVDEDRWPRPSSGRRRPCRGTLPASPLSCPAMPYFKDAEEVYANLGRLFEDIVADDELRSRFQGADTVFQYRMRRPDSQVTVKALQEAEPQVEFGITELRPEVVLAMDADTAHRFWLGKVNITVALARGQISARGPVAKILKRVPRGKPVQPRYESQLEAAGRSDLSA